MSLPIMQLPKQKRESRRSLLLRDIVAASNCVLIRRHIVDGMSEREPYEGPMGTGGCRRGEGAGPARTRRERDWVLRMAWLPSGPFRDPHGKLCSKAAWRGGTGSLERAGRLGRQPYARQPELGEMLPYMGRIGKGTMLKGG